MGLSKKPDFYYLESDGQVFLIQNEGLWTFPRTLAELPASIDPVFEMPIDGYRILFAKPRLDHHPTHWINKDELVGRLDVSPLVHRAINRSLPRAAAKVAIIEKGKVLMVMARRGLTQGMWNLPGGFVGYAEHPAESAVREVQEELGIGVRLTRLVGVYSQAFPRTGGYMISFVYQGTRLQKTLTLHPEEMEEARWMSLPTALRLTRNPFVKKGLRDILKSKNL